jgi:hypothetical protein
MINCQYQELTLILKIIGDCDVIYIMMLPIKTIGSALMASTYIFTGISACPVDNDNVCLDRHN